MAEECAGLCGIVWATQLIFPLLCSHFIIGAGSLGTAFSRITVIMALDSILPMRGASVNLEEKQKVKAIIILMAVAGNY